MIFASIPLIALDHASAAGAADISGFWLTKDGEAVIEMFACEQARRCGSVAWLKKPLGADGRPLADVNNTDEKLRNRRVCGLVIAWGLSEQPDGSWGNGRGYDPDDGKSYTVDVALIANDQLSFTGYVGIRLLGRTETWTRAPTGLNGC